MATDPETSIWVNTDYRSEVNEDEKSVVKQVQNAVSKETQQSLQQLSQNSKETDDNALISTESLLAARRLLGQDPNYKLNLLNGDGESDSTSDDLSSNGNGKTLQKELELLENISNTSTSPRAVSNISRLSKQNSSFSTKSNKTKKYAMPLPKYPIKTKNVQRARKAPSKQNPMKRKKSKPSSSGNNFDYELDGFDFEDDDIDLDNDDDYDDDENVTSDDDDDHHYHTSKKQKGNKGKQIQSSTNNNNNSMFPNTIYYNPGPKFADERVTKKRSGNPFEIQKFNLAKMNVLSNFLIIGKRNSGKTNFLKYLLYYLCAGGPNHFGKVAVMSGTEDENHMYEKEFGIPTAFIRGSADCQFLERLLTMQLEIVKPLSNHEKEDLKHALLIIIDDLAYDKNFLSNPKIVQMMFNGRHRLVSILIISQDAKGPLCRTRSNFDYVITSRNADSFVARDCYKFYFSMFPSESDYYATMQHYTQNFGFIISDNTASKNSIHDQYGWARALNLKNKAVKYILNYEDTRPYLKYISGEM